jgi:hypothetical protein
VDTARQLSYSETIRFDIPPQSLVTALDAFGKRTNVQILYKVQLVQGVRSPGVVGEYPAQEALQHLLKETGLTASYADQRAFTLVLVSSSESVTASNMQAASTLALPPIRVEATPFDTLAYDSYSRLVRARVEQVLASRARSGTAERTLRIMVWINRVGFIEKPMVYATSGDRVVDAEVVNNLIGVPVNASPPAGLPQPLFIRISKR